MGLEHKEFRTLIRVARALTFTSLSLVLILYNLISPVRAQESSAPMAQIVLKDMLKKDFDLDVDIAGGLGQSADDPIVVLSSTDYESVKTELLVLRGLGLGRGIFWRTLETNMLTGSSGPIIQRKIETKDVQKEQVVTQTEAYYFRRIARSSARHPPQSAHIVRYDDSIDIGFPYELSWLHFDDVVDNEHLSSSLGYSIFYNAPGIKATIYVYPTPTGSFATTIYLDELKKARSEIIGIYGENFAEYEWEIQDLRDHAIYSFIPADDPSTTSFLMVTMWQSHFIKIRATFFDDPITRTISNDFANSVLELIRSKTLH